jgi:hypothetical protein
MFGFALEENQTSLSFEREAGLSVAQETLQGYPATQEQILLLLTYTGRLTLTD